MGGVGFGGSSVCQCAVAASWGRTVCGRYAKRLRCVGSGRSGAIRIRRESRGRFGGRDPRHVWHEPAHIIRLSCCRRLRMVAGWATDSL
jgi:hypothetical protein